MRVARACLAVGVAAVLLAGAGPVFPAAAHAEPAASPSELPLHLPPIPIPLPVAPELAMQLWPLVSFREPAPVLDTDRPEVIADQYLVLFAPDIPDEYFDHSVDVLEQWDAQLQFVYDGTVKGFAAVLPEVVVERFQHHPYTWFVEADQVMRGSATQSDAPWGLDRIDQRSRSLNNRYSYHFTGSGVTAYVLDTGIRARHKQFEGRVIGGATAINDGRGASDCNGHGTHVAGTIGGRRYGVAKKVRLFSMRVLGCNNTGSTSTIIAGIDWVTKHHRSPAVANVSIGSPASSAVDQALKKSIQSGVTYVVAAGNGNRDACGVSPARLPAAITVGATRPSDERASFSNKGRCVDVFAPGYRIWSTWYSSNTAVSRMSGTSMASPHVAGVAALYLQRYPNASAASVHKAVLTGATKNVVSKTGGSPNRLVYSRL